MLQARGLCCRHGTWSQGESPLQHLPHTNLHPAAATHGPPNQTTRLHHLGYLCVVSSCQPATLTLTPATPSLSLPRLCPVCRDETYTRILKSQPSLPSHLSPAGKDFLCQCLRKEPGERPTVAQLLKHPWIRAAQLGLQVCVALAFY